MPFVLGRERDADAGPACRLGRYRARDGSCGAELYLDVDGPHAALVVGKRGYGKSYTLGVLAEDLARADGVAPVVVDPMGVFERTAAGAVGDEPGVEPVPVRVVDEPRVAPSSLDPRSWCELLGLSPESGAGSLVWRAAQDAETLAGMRERVAEADAPAADRRAARNHLDLADAWDVFDAGGATASAFTGGELTVVDVSGLDRAPTSAVLRGVAEALYRGRVEEQFERLPWLLVDEAHVAFDGVARAALETILTRGRAPGVSLVLATQRPAAVPEVAISQSDLLLAHRLTAEDDLAALERAQPTYLDGSLADRLPSEPGEVVAIDDVTESVHAARVRERDTPHGGDSPRASEVVAE